MFAVIETGGKQYKVSEGQKLKIEKLPKNEGEAISFDKVLLIADDAKTDIGRPYLEAKVEAIVIRQARATKINIMRYHSKTRRRRRKGHRQHFTEVEIRSIQKKPSRATFE